MSGLLALLDDVAGIAKVAAASVDDVAGQAAKAGSKVAGVVIDDAAVTPKYVTGFEPARELPIIWKITKGSLFNKIVVLLPALLLLNAFAPFVITPLLMLGGAYLCFEGAEKIHHALFSHDKTDDLIKKKVAVDAAVLEEKKAAGAIKTDFILSAEIMTIALAAIPPSNFWMEAATLATVAIGITIAVYGSVALIVKADDIGLYMSSEDNIGPVRWLGRGIVHAMPGFMKILTTIGTAAMLWVGGSIVIHSLEQLGLGWLGHHIHDWAAVVGSMASESWAGAAEWTSKATMDGIFGLILGMCLIPIVARALQPAWSRLRGK